MRIHVSITTCDRPEMLARLLRQIDEQGAGYELSCLVVDDATEDLKSLMKSVLHYPYTAIDSDKERLGKERFWELMDIIFEDAKERDFDYWFHMPDDVELEPDFFTRAIEYHREGTLLNPLRVDADYSKGNFSSPLPRQMANGLIRTDWNDCCWVADRTMGEALDWNIEPIDPIRWRMEPHLGSGVGSQITRRLTERVIEMYQVPVTLMRHGDHPSIMNPEERKRNPLIA